MLLSRHLASSFLLFFHQNDQEKENKVPGHQPRAPGRIQVQAPHFSCAYFSFFLSFLFHYDQEKRNKVPGHQPSASRRIQVQVPHFSCFFCQYCTFVSE